jgi:hypothetical protein
LLLYWFIADVVINITPGDQGGFFLFLLVGILSACIATAFLVEMVHRSWWKNRSIGWRWVYIDLDHVVPTVHDDVAVGGLLAHQ